jgi:formate hydrogenlyase subunit 3/multisubunit Na+/H+ antiporter MnhD subunit
MWRVDILSSYIAAFIGMFGVLVVIYSIGFMKGKPRLFWYFLYTFLTIITSIGTVFANNLVLLLIFWGFLGLLLYLLINFGDKNSNAVAKKTFIIVGGSDSLMILGIGIVYLLTGTFQMDKIRLEPSSLSVIAFICLIVAAFAKAGAMPFHTWIPDTAESAPSPVSALLPASLDKLLGIYLLFRISAEMFIMNEPMRQSLLIIGAVTILAAVMMALVQHNFKRLLGYHAVSQVGYMIIGISTGNPIGIAGGLFHMINNAIYKSCLFLIGGAVENKKGTSELDKLGGLSRVMPVTFFCAIIASLSISGVPPFNGFVSKWMIYQGLISQFTVHSSQFTVTKFVIIFCLIAAMFGSALTLASFLKLLHAVFLGQRSYRSTVNRQPSTKIDEVNSLMWLPMVVLALLCIIFGIFTNQLPLKYFILPSVKDAAFIGIWNSHLATLLIIAGILLGFVILLLGNLSKSLRLDNSYVGTEIIPSENRPSGAEFYNTIKEFGILKGIYNKAEEGFFDIYEQGKRFVFFISGILGHLHNGVLPTYLVWCLLGMMGVLYSLLLK